MKLQNLLVYVWKSWPKGARGVVQTCDGKLQVCHDNSNFLAKSIFPKVKEPNVSKQEFDDVSKSVRENEILLKQYDPTDPNYKQFVVAVEESIKKHGQLNLNELIAEIAHREHLLSSIFTVLHGKPKTSKTGMQSLIVSHFKGGGWGDYKTWPMSNGEYMNIYQDDLGRLCATESLQLDSEQTNHVLIISAPYPLANNRVKRGGTAKVFTLKDIIEYTRQ